MKKTLDHPIPESIQEDNRMEIEEDNEENEGKIFFSQYEKDYLDQEKIAHENDQDTASKCKDKTEKSKKDEEKKIEEKRNPCIIRTSENGETKKLFVVDLDECNTDTNAKNLLGKKKHEIKVEKKQEENKKEKAEKVEKLEIVEKNWSNMAITECSDINKRKKKNDTNVINIKNNTNIDMGKKNDFPVNYNVNDEDFNNLCHDNPNTISLKEEEFYGNDDDSMFNSEQCDVSQTETNSNRNNFHSVENPHANPSSTDISLNNHMGNLHI